MSCIERQTIYLCKNKCNVKKNSIYWNCWVSKLQLYLSKSVQHVLWLIRSRLVYMLLPCTQLAFASLLSFSLGRAMCETHTGFYFYINKILYMWKLYVYEILMWNGSVFIWNILFYFSFIWLLYSFFFVCVSVVTFECRILILRRWTKPYTPHRLIHIYPTSYIYIIHFPTVSTLLYFGYTQLLLRAVLCGAVVSLSVLQLSEHSLSMCMLFVYFFFFVVVVVC